MAIVYQSPQKYKKNKTTLFLAGAIDMGQAEDWQEKVTQYLIDQDIIMLNPRRKNWDNSLLPTTDTPQFVEQVQWELEGQDLADAIIFVFPASAKAPVTFLELGMALGRKKCFVYTHPDFYRKGNIELTCKHFNVLVHENLNEMLKEVQDYLKIKDIN